MGASIDITSQRFSRLFVVGRGANKGKQYGWNCICDCGNTTHVAGSSLRSGYTKSCGCLRDESISNRVTKHGMSSTSEHGIWLAMKRRCYNVNNPDYHRYGGRGIKVCDRWLESFKNFYADMGAKPEGHSIDRIDYNGDYTLENCKWSNSFEQANNKSTNARYVYGDEEHTIAEWSRIVDMPQTLLRKRLHSGMKMPYALYNIDYRYSNV